MSDLESEVTDTYFGDVLQSWNNGVQIDLRVKLAIEFLVRRHPAQGESEEGARTAEYALQIWRMR